jgi:hypothetical protein
LAWPQPVAAVAAFSGGWSFPLPVAKTSLAIEMVAEKVLQFGVGYIAALLFVFIYPVSDSYFRSSEALLGLGVKYQAGILVLLSPPPEP